MSAEVCLSVCKVHFCSHSWSSCCVVGNPACAQALACELSSPLPLRTFASEMQNSLCGILKKFVVHFKLPFWNVFQMIFELFCAQFVLLWISLPILIANIQV